MAMIKCKGCHKEISDNAKVCPHCGEPGSKKTSLAVWLFLIIIIAMGLTSSNNNSYEPDPYGQNQSVSLTPKEESKDLIKLDSFEWSRGGFDTVLMADFKIKNNSKYLVKDIEITCSHNGKSGTEIGSNRKIIYDSIIQR